MVTARRCRGGLGSVEGVNAAGILALGVAVVWLAVGSLTARGAQRRGQRWRFAWLSGLLFPVSWVIWYLVDERAAGGRATRRRRREAL
jgi:hypothetical protein